MTNHRFVIGVATLTLAAGAINLASCAGGSNGTGAGGSGATGATGVAGSGGPAGTAGSGATGVGGTTGAAGTNGTTGVAGTNGTTGVAGSGGATGTAGGGATGTAGSGGGGNAGTATCPANAVLCDDFESGTAGQAPNPQKWMVDLLGGTGTVQIDGTKGHNSSKSLHVNGNNGQFHTMAQVSGAPVFPLPNSVLYARAYLMLPGAMPTGHVIWIEAGAVTNDVAETRFGANIGQLDVNHWPGDQEQRAPGTSIGDGAWHCVEIMYDSMQQLAEVWLDNTELTDLYVTNWVAPMQQNGNNTTPLTNWSPSYAAIRFGWELNGAEIWYDDVAIGYGRLGCDQ